VLTATGSCFPKRPAAGRAAHHWRPSKWQVYEWVLNLHSLKGLQNTDRDNFMCTARTILMTKVVVLQQPQKPPPFIIRRAWSKTIRHIDANRYLTQTGPPQSQWHDGCSRRIKSLLSCPNHGRGHSVTTQVFGDTIKGTPVPSRKRWYTACRSVHRSVSFPHTFQVIQRCQVGCSAEIIRMQNITHALTDCTTDSSLRFGPKTEHEILRQKNLLLPECVELYLHKWTSQSKRPGYTYSPTTVILSKIQTSQQTYRITITKISRIMLLLW